MYTNNSPRTGVAQVGATMKSQEIVVPTWNPQTETNLKGPSRVRGTVGPVRNVQTMGIGTV